MRFTAYRRGWARPPILAGVLALTGACGSDAPPRPAADPIAGYRAPRIVERDGARQVENAGPRERLRIYGELNGPARLLFLRGRATMPLPDGRTAWVDVERARVLVFGRDGSVEEILPDAARPEVRATARSIQEFELAPVRPDDPLIRLLDDRGAVVRTVGRVEVPDNAFLGQLVNAGWVALAEDGSIYFAAALRPELRCYDREGRLRWRSTRPLSEPPPPPRLTAPDGQLQPVFTPIDHGIALGPDGRIYVLGAAGVSGSPDHLYVFERDGRLMRAGEVGPEQALFADRSGRLYALAPEAVLERAGASKRAEFPPFALPTLSSGDTLRLQRFQGRIVVLNFWASWCGPCRREMPLLERYAREVDPARVAIIGLNEDASVEDARAFIREVGVAYPNVAGRGRLRAKYPYRGLPYTVVLDRELRVIETFYGFGETLDPIRGVVEAELARAAASPAPPPVRRPGG